MSPPVACNPSYDSKLSVVINNNDTAIYTQSISKAKRDVTKVNLPEDAGDHNGIELAYAELPSGE